LTYIYYLHNPTCRYYCYLYIFLNLQLSPIVLNSTCVGVGEVLIYYTYIRKNKTDEFVGDHLHT